MKLNNILLPYLIRKTARAHGFLDPIRVLTQLARFGQPAEVLAPTELLRSGALFHARGLINSQAIQHNLDWVWPYWVERQFDPRDKAFIPRAFQLTHVNLTHRNWTAIGLPNRACTPIVDPCGLVTPFWDGWSIDFWIIDDTGKNLYPSKIENVKQKLRLSDNLAVVTKSRLEDKELIGEALVRESRQQVFCQINLTGVSQKSSWLAVSLRPYNPEGVSFIESIKELEEAGGWMVNEKDRVIFSEKPEKYQFSQYRKGDVANYSFKQKNIHQANCSVGMATAVAFFKVEANQPKQVEVKIPLESKCKTKVLGWDSALSGSSKLNISNQLHKELYNTALRTLILHSVDEVFAGPYTYRRFWFRDAVFIVYALLCAGFKERARQIIEQFPQRQKFSGYFSSQEGEWDSNGEVLWILRKYVEMSNRNLSSSWVGVVKKAGEWIIKKRLSKNEKILHSGLMPAGFSAEHLGPNDYYYWDNFWSVAGLEAGAYLMEKFGKHKIAEKFKEEAILLMDCIDKSIKGSPGYLNSNGIPASCYRRMDSGAIGSLAAGYPLQLWDKGDSRLLETVNYLLKHCFVGDGFFHDMSHSGINPYLTLHVAQVLLRTGDKKFGNLMSAIAGLATSTGQWPEAIHPATKGGCMGDGQHVWAASEWIVMVRNCFVYEEKQGRSLILCSGILPNWYKRQSKISLGPAPTSFGDIEIVVTFEQEKILVSWHGNWHKEEPSIKISLPGFNQVTAPVGTNQVTLSVQGKNK